jgi:serine phosphatase RsbU (regulator of sigma subunit)
MIASTLLQDSVSTFLMNVAKYTGIPLCLIDHDGHVVVRTPVTDCAGYASEIGYGTERKIDLRDNTVWRLYTLDQPIPGTEILRDQVLDFAAEVIVFIINNEEEMQNLATELLERYQELHVLYDVVNNVSALLKEDEICTAVLRKAMQTLDVQAGAVVFVDQNGAPEIRCKLEDGFCLIDEDLMRYAEQVYESNMHLIIERSQAEFNWALAATASVLAVPIVVNNAPLGSMIVSSKRSDEDFTSGDRISLTALAGYLGIAITSAQLIKEAHEADALRQEFDFARKIQQSLLPKELPKIATLEIAARCIAATQVGGDLFTFLPIGADTWAIGVADVSGHGLGAAFILASLRSILRSECRRGTTIEESIRDTNDILCEDTQDSELFATLLMTSYNDKTRTLRSVNAGHPPGLLWKAATQSLVTLEQGGMAVGLFRDEIYGFDELTLEPGDVLALYTDGIIECKNNNGELYGIERLHACFTMHVGQSAGMIIDAILGDIGIFHHGVSQNDDVTVVIVKAR